MQKYFINKLIDNIASFNKEDIHHIINVMRFNINDEVIGFYENKRYLLKIINLDPLRAIVLKQINQETKNNFELNVYIATIKPKYLELAIVKACELNVSNFYIFYSNYAQHNIEHNIQRYKRIIKEACEQANRSDLLNLEIINNHEQLINSLNNNDLNIIADFTNKKTSLESILTKPALSIGLIIGCEGGFSQKDYDTIFNNINYVKLNLTKTILRSETAMMYLVSVVSYILLKNEK